MKRVSLKDLKENLASWIELAHQGTPVEIMKYNKPFVMLVPRNPSELRVGSKFGRASLKSCLKDATKGKWKEYLDEDRNS